jgi:hypothetical protein
MDIALFRISGCEGEKVSTRADTKQVIKQHEKKLLVQRSRHLKRVESQMQYIRDITGEQNWTFVPGIPR